MITVQVDQHMLNYTMFRLGRISEKAPTAVARAVNKTAVTARKHLVQKAQEVYTIKSGGLKKDVKIKNATRATLTAIIHSGGKNIRVPYFKTSVPKSGAKAEIIRGTGLKPLARAGGKAFRPPGSKAIVARTSGGRYPLDTFVSVGVPRMIGNEERVYGVVEPMIQATFNKYVNQQIKLLLSKG